MKEILQKLLNLLSMKQKMQFIALRTVRHNDRHSILSAYSAECGRVAFAISAGGGKEAVRRRALFMPLSIVECVADVKPGRDICVVSEPRSVVSLMGLRSNPIKGSIAMFLAEVLGVVLRDGPPDVMLYRYISGSIEALDALPADRVANFHICFLWGLGRFIGIEPDTSEYCEGMVFDMQDGRFRRSAPLHPNYLDSSRSSAVAAVSRMTYINMHLFKMSRAERNELLNGVLKYYSMHYAGLQSLRSLDVLRELF